MVTSYIGSQHFLHFFPMSVGLYKYAFTVILIRYCLKYQFNHFALCWIIDTMGKSQSIGPHWQRGLVWCPAYDLSPGMSLQEYHIPELCQEIPFQIQFCHLQQQVDKKTDQRLLWIIPNIRTLLSMLIALRPETAVGSFALVITQWPELCS